MTYRARREVLHRSLGVDDGVILWMGATLQPRNYPDNPYMPFRQDSHFLYYVGISVPNVAVLSFPDGKEILFGHPIAMDTIVWEGPQPSLEERAQEGELSSWEDIRALQGYLAKVDNLLYLPPYLGSTTLRLCSLLERTPEQVRHGFSEALAQAVVAQRSCKTEAEVEAIEEALALTSEMFHEAMAMTQPGLPVPSLLGHFYKRVREKLWDFSFTPIVTHHGETLHTHDYDDSLESGRLLLVDMGVETPSGYASDITRTWPIDGEFTIRQRDIYNVVLQSQLDAIGAIRPGVTYRDVHLVAAQTIAQGLIDLGLMQGNAQDAVAEGAHALFFPHGVGHMMGGDVHDMEDLGDRVGYVSGESRSSQFGLNFLRLSRPLETGYVVTVEPGIYFIPALVDMWHSEHRLASFIRYDVVASYLSFGGIRIEDDVLVTPGGARVLGLPIVKEVEDVETMMNVDHAPGL